MPGAESSAGPFFVAGIAGGQQRAKAEEQGSFSIVKVVIKGVAWSAQGPAAKSVQRFIGDPDDVIADEGRASSRATVFGIYAEFHSSTVQPEVMIAPVCRKWL
jgi:hypothetical protein